VQLQISNVAHIGGSTKHCYLFLKFHPKESVCNFRYHWSKSLNTLRIALIMNYATTHLLA